jgi:hypothetical protein
MTLSITPEQEAKLAQYLSNNQPHEENYSAMSNSCVTVCEHALQAAGVLPNSTQSLVAVDRAGTPIYGKPSGATLPSTLKSEIEATGKVQATETVGKKDPVSLGRSVAGVFKSVYRKVFGR